VRPAGPSLTALRGGARQELEDHIRGEACFGLSKSWTQDGDPSGATPDPSHASPGT